MRTAILVTALCALAPAQASADRCAECHATLPAKGFVAAHLKEWADSPHAQAKVGCAACHGGDAAAADKEAAHQGVFNSGNPRSRVHFQQMPNTCGSCHARVLDRFEESKHFRALVEEGKGPTCATCHTAMGSAVLSADEVGRKCAACHKPGGLAPDDDNARLAARLMVELDATERLLETVETLAAYAASRGAALPEDRKISEARARFTGVTEQWHRFNPEGVRRDVQTAVRLIGDVQRAAAAAARKKGGKR
jgi:hypothetical protein